MGFIIERQGQAGSVFFMHISIDNLPSRLYVDVHTLVGVANVCDHDLVFQNRSLSFLLTISCNVVFRIFLIHKTFQLEMVKKLRNSNLNCDR
jgi:hypothetical protein